MCGAFTDQQVADNEGRKHEEVNLSSYAMLKATPLQCAACFTSRVEGGKYSPPPPTQIDANLLGPDLRDPVPRHRPAASDVV